MAARTRIITEHTELRQDAPRRREIARGSFAPAPRTGGGGRHQIGKKKLPVGPGSIQRKNLKTEITVPSAAKRVIRIEEQIGLQALAGKMSLKSTDVLMKLIKLGMTNVTINSTLDSDTASLLASEFGYEVENVFKSDNELEQEARGSVEQLDADILVRAPIVTVMGHVDHGKTSLLDRIRKANVAKGEAGGITQHIGAYRVETHQGPIVFLDTPGHEAFTAMRARGAQATDVVVLVVASDDGVMPQTKEAINHAKAAEVPIIVAVTKIDKHDARPESIRTELANLGLQAEEWGGDTLFVNVSAHTGEGIDTLLENIALQSELLELKANAKVPAEGVVLEAYLDKGKGVVANVLIQNGTLSQGDMILAGASIGKIRALSDDKGRKVKEAGPATPVEVLGLADLPSAGDTFLVVTDAKKAQEIADARKKALALKSQGQGMKGLDQLQKMLQTGENHDLNLVVKADVQGSIEAIVKALTELSTDKVQVQVIHTGVGGITENDVMLAAASNAIVIGFNVRPAGQASTVARNENIEIRVYSVIYEAVDEVKKAMTGLLDPTFKEKELGKAEVRDVFSIPKIGTIAGCYVLDGKVVRSAKVRLVRDSVQIWTGQVGSLRRFKDDVKEVTSGYECGISLDGFSDLKVKDQIEFYEMEKIAATL